MKFELFEKHIVAGVAKRKGGGKSKYTTTFLWVVSLPKWNEGGNSQREDRIGSTTIKCRTFL